MYKMIAAGTAGVGRSKMDLKTQIRIKMDIRIIEINCMCNVGCVLIDDKLCSRWMNAQETSGSRCE